MEKERLKKLLLDEEKKAFIGWDFSYLHGRIKDEQFDWDYETIIRQYLETDMQLLDMGTGGGEFLLTLQHPYHHTSVTEGYLANYKLCLKTLAPLGIQVKRNDDVQHIPYPDHSFDIVINRHESYDLAEVKRVLKENGIFITQQIGKQNDVDLVERVLNKKVSVDSQNDLTHALQKAKELGFRVLMAKEAITPILFYDLGHSSILRKLFHGNLSALL